MSTASIPKAGRNSCPICGKPAEPAHLPFCSRGCRDRDLLNWLGETYRAPGPVADGFEEIDPDTLDSEGRPPL